MGVPTNRSDHVTAAGGRDLSRVSMSRERSVLACKPREVEGTAGGDDEVPLCGLGSISCVW